MEGRTFQVQGDPLPVLHQGFLQRKRKLAQAAKAHLPVPIPNVFLITDAVFFLPLLLLQSHLGNVLVDMKLIDIKDTLPVGFIPIQETVDTRE